MIERETLYRLLPLALLAAALVALGTAYTAELGFGYEPCELCLFQRVPYALIAVLGLVALFAGKLAVRRAIALVAAVVFLIGAAIAFYHVGVEQTWWQSATSCGASTTAVTSTQDLFAALQHKAPKSCGDVDWTLFGVSMATYNVGFQIVLALGAFLAWRRLGEGN